MFIQTDLCLVCVFVFYAFLDGYSSTIQGLLDWFDVDLGLTNLLLFRLICVLFVSFALLLLSPCPFWTSALPPPRKEDFTGQYMRVCI